MMLDSDAKALEKGVVANVKVLQTRIDIGRGTQTDMNQALARLSTTQRSAR